MAHTKTIELLRDYDAKLTMYEAFTAKLRSLVDEILAVREQNVHSVTSRTKARTSLDHKISTSGSKYSSIDDVTDITGIRVITYFSDDVDRVADIIAAEFEVDEKNSIDKRAVLDPDRFGYLSLHYVVKLRPSRAGLLEYSRFPDLKAEIQIRSILQHAWAEIEHDLGYKTAAGVPRSSRREFSQLAGLLEIADKEFAAIRDDLAAYEAQLAEGLNKSPETMLIDKASLRYFMSARSLIREVDEEIAAAIGAVIAKGGDGVPEWHVGTLQAAGITSVAQLEAQLRQHREALPRFGVHWVKQIERWHGSVPQVTEGFSLQYLAFFIAGERADEACLSAVLDEFCGGDLKRRARLAEDISGARTRYDGEVTGTASLGS